jgi:type IX secretion system PorP/SprF family membrane protein
LKGSAFNTYSVSYDQKMPVGRTDYFGIGGAFWGDVAGQSRFGTLQAKLSGSYSKKMGGYRKTAHFLVFGVEGAFSQRNLSQGDLLFGDQIDPTSGPTQDPTQDPLDDYDFFYGDVSAGLLWFSVLDEFTNFYFGMAFHHLNQPDQSFYQGTQRVPLYTKFTVHGGGQFEIQPRVSFIPNIVFMMQGPHMEANLGTSVRFAMGNSRTNEQGFQLGAWYRLGNQYENKLHSDAIILSSRFDYQNFGIGLSYDINISKLRQASSANNAIELSLSYNICGPEHRGIYCPKF